MNHRKIVAQIRSEPCWQAGIKPYGARFAAFRHTDYFVPSFTLKSS
jgi:hypothetical protein